MERSSSAALLGGRYLLGEAFASGGMGTVHLGRAVGAGGFSRVVAIKQLFPHLAADSSFRQMLLDEARFASRIRHPNVVPMLDVVEAERDLFVVMEYVHGLSIAQVLERGEGGPPVPAPIVIAVVEAVLLGLHAVHEARGEDGTPLGIVHRDVSPQNVLLGADGIPRLIDFGIAKAATRVQVTEAGVVKGKVGYVAPEQLVHEAVSRHADVYSCGVLLWEMLAGRRLFDGADVAARLRQLDERAPPPIDARRTARDVALEAIVAQALARDPSRRFGTAEAMAAALRAGRAVASAADIAKWIADTAPDDLEISEERVRLLEQSSASARGDRGDRGGEVSRVSVAGPATTASTVANAAPSEVSSLASGVSAAPARRARKRLAVGGALALLVVVLFFGARAFERGGVAAPPPIATVDPAPTSAPSAITPTLATASAVAAPATSALAAPAAKGSARAHHAPKGRCDPPYTVDANGIRRYDRSCF